MASADNNYILVTGGAGYVGSHCVVELLNSGHRVVVVDTNAAHEVIRRIEDITGKTCIFHKLDISDGDALRGLFLRYNFSSVIHLAALKAVGESARIPLKYYHNNVGGAIVLLEVMREFNVRNIVFSSSATVYGEPAIIPIPETCPTAPISPYGRTKTMVETIIHDVCDSEPGWNAVILRYFNPAGAHPSGKMGEDPRGVPNNLMPYLAQVAVGKRELLNVFGNDYASKDGTCIRDYIHVVDLAQGHLAALNKLNDSPGYVVYNLGTGVGYTVLDMVRAFSQVVGRELPYKIGPRRPGDVTDLTADPSLANRELNWRAQRSLEEMCRDLWRWQSNNPHGYDTDLSESPADHKEQL
ncbi:uncharacterized protein VTP21DRAFT_1014 [Calcarisporiella thermophila]|uniref:uncharacterized protein n=1 Tax=Calcarisporiella thermophila TaxID=911321 RepID=UPI003743A05A